MLFFLSVWILVAVRVFRSRPEEMDARARLALEGDGEAPADLPAGASPRS
jgi:hypothetical protein